MTAVPSAENPFRSSRAIPSSDNMDTERERELKQRLESLREEMPETPLDAERKAMEISLLEEELAELYESQGVESTAESDSDLDSLTEQIRSITDEIMAIEIQMLKADMAGDESQRIKLQLSANALKSRRQTLIDEVKARNTAPAAEKKDDLEERVAALEKEVADIKALLYRLLTR